jgi:hypothetical protein
MEDKTMNTVSRFLFSVSICTALSSAAYAQSATLEPTKPAAPAVEAKHKSPALAKHKPVAPSESIAGDKSKSSEAREHAKPAQPIAAPKPAKTSADKTSADKTDADKLGASSKAAHHEIKPAAKPAKPAVKPESAVEAPKATK